MQKRAAEDRQILNETINSQKVVNHPTYGSIRFKMPTLEIQRKVDSVARTKKKVLREATDFIPDPENPEKQKAVPSFKSKQVLEKEYQANGWWTTENEEKLTELTNNYVGYVTQLELLGFESQESIYEDLADARQKLATLVNLTDEVETALSSLVLIGRDDYSAEKKIIMEAATSTEVDDILKEVDVLHRQFQSYAELAKIYGDLVRLEQEKSSLFSDSWQHQLEYYIKLAQVFYCTERVEDSTALFENVEAIEQYDDVEFVGWLMAELNALWQGLSDDYRERMGKYGFTDRLSTEKSSSEESLAQTESSQDGDSVEKVQTPSLEPTDTQVQ